MGALFPRYVTAGQEVPDRVKAEQLAALERFKQVILMRDRQGLTFEEIASRLKVSRIRASHLYRRAHRCWSDSVPFTKVTR